jgi:hypothetical protein
MFSPELTVLPFFVSAAVTANHVLESNVLELHGRELRLVP